MLAKKVNRSKVVVSRRRLLQSAGALVAVAAVEQFSAGPGEAAAASQAITESSGNYPVTPDGLPLQTPLEPGGTSASLARLRKGSGGKTPTVKDISPSWVAALGERGDPEIYTRTNSNNFAHIGMPIGGIGAGQLYIQGDGRLDYWDIFNSHSRQRIAQGFAVRWKKNGKEHDLVLDKAGFSDISFLGQYPIAEVNYADAKCPLKIKLEAFSPFIPLNLDDSAYPATVINFTLTNAGNAPVVCAITGWMENMICRAAREHNLGNRRNRIVKYDGFAALVSDVRPEAGDPLRTQPDFGTTALAVLGESTGDIGRAAVEFKNLPAQCFDAGDHSAQVPCQDTLVGSIGRSLMLNAGASKTVTFILAWHFPNPFYLNLKTDNRRWFGTHFTSAADVVTRLAKNMDRLAGATRLWRDTWYDSTLPYWLLDRTFLNTSTLATDVSYLLADGRFYAYEGDYCCPGTCTHVWGYTHVLGCLFPVIEKRLREMVDFNPAIGMNPDGSIAIRGEFNRSSAVDGQCGVIFRMLRACRMSTDSAFLKKNYEPLTKAMNWLINVYDRHHNGLLGGQTGQGNTQDAVWYGTIAWLSVYYQGALRAYAEMADQIGRHKKAAAYRRIADRGATLANRKLFNGEYFIQLPDPKRPHSVGSYDGCEIDQLLGQSWAYQMGMGPIVDPTKISTALEALWKYNFTTDGAEYHKYFTQGRSYLLPDGAETLMCTWPKGPLTFLGLNSKPLGYAGYLNECWTGCEYSLASLMIWHGMVDKGLAITRAVHDRYRATKRNPWSEVECGSHYSRAMASYGVFTALCGFDYDGPKGYIAFAPRMTPENFRAAFTSARGWGTFWQKYASGVMHAGLVLRHGKLQLKTIALQMPLKVERQRNARRIEVKINGRSTPATGKRHKGLFAISFSPMLQLDAGSELTVTIS